MISPVAKNAFPPLFPLSTRPTVVPEGFPAVACRLWSHHEKVAGGEPIAEGVTVLRFGPNEARKLGTGSGTAVSPACTHLEGHSGKPPSWGGEAVGGLGGVTSWGLLLGVGLAEVVRGLCVF